MSRKKEPGVMWAGTSNQRQNKKWGKKSKNCSTGAFGKGIGTRSERAHEPGAMRAGTRNQGPHVHPIKGYGYSV